jgi:hypothetical protein
MREVRISKETSDTRMKEEEKAGDLGSNSQRMLI